MRRGGRRGPRPRKWIPGSRLVKIPGYRVSGHVLEVSEGRLTRERGGVEVLVCPVPPDTTGVPLYPVPKVLRRPGL